MREGGLEPPSLSAPDPKSGASASFATLAEFGVPKKITPIPRTLEECGSASAGSSGCVYGAVIVNVMPIVYVPGLSVSQWTTGRKYTLVEGVPDPGKPVSIVASVVDTAVETPDGVRLQ